MTHIPHVSTDILERHLWCFFFCYYKTSWNCYSLRIWNWRHLNLCYQARATHIWLQNKLSLVPFEVRVVFLCQEHQPLPSSPVFVLIEDFLESSQVVIRQGIGTFSTVLLPPRARGLKAELIWWIILISHYPCNNPKGGSSENLLCHRNTEMTGEWHTWRSYESSQPPPPCLALGILLFPYSLVVSFIANWFSTQCRRRILRTFLTLSQLLRTTWSNLGLWVVSEWGPCYEFEPFPCGISWYLKVDNLII